MKRERLLTVMGSICLTLVLAALLLPACAAEEAPVPTPAPTPKQEPIVLKHASQAPAGSPFSNIDDAWLDEVEKRSNGLITFERYHGQALVKTAEIAEAVDSGIADTGKFVPSYTPGKYPLATVGVLPFTMRSAWINHTSFYQLVRQVPELEAEFTRNNARIVTGWSAGPYYVYSRTPIRTFEDFKGKKIIATGAIGELLQSMGASVLGIVITESYEALQKGTADGAVYGPSAGGTYHLEEVCKYLLKLPLGGTCGPIAMNLDVWNKLSPEMQTMIDELQPDHAKANMQVYQIDGDSKYLKQFEEAGMEFIEPSAELLAKVEEIALNETWGRWADDQEAAGLAGRKTLDAFLALLKENTPKDPFKGQY